MKRLLLFALVLILASPAAVFAIRLTDYTFPDTFYQDAELTGEFNYKDGNQDQGSYNASALLNYDIKYSTLPFEWKLEADGDLSLERGPQEEDESEDGYNFNLYTYANKYLNQTKIYGYGDIDFKYRKLKAADDADDPYVHIGVGAGYGRVIDATPLAEAMRIVDDLKKFGVVQGSISDPAYLEMASIIDKEDEFESKYGAEEYEQYWIEALEEVLKKENALKSGAFGATGVIRTRAILLPDATSTRGVELREHGWKAQAGLGYLASDYEGESDDDPTLNALFQYTLPYSYRMQLIETLTYRTILDDDVKHHVSNELKLTYEISDRIDWINLWQLNWDQDAIADPASGDLNDSMYNHFKSTFKYYISNLLSANITFKLTHLDDGIDDEDIQADVDCLCDCSCTCASCDYTYNCDPFRGNDDVEFEIALGFTYELR